MSESLIGIIGGSGLYEMEGLKITDERRLETPFGDPSDAYLLGELEGKPVAFLPRHGRGHRISPSELNFRANIWGMKKLGAERIIGVSAVGSLKEEIRPGEMVIIDQFIDRTHGRPSTFFTDGVVAHVGFADPLCPVLRRLLIEAGKKAEVVFNDNLIVTIESFGQIKAEEIFKKAVEELKKDLETMSKKIDKE